MACIENTPIRNSLVGKEQQSGRLVQQIDQLKRELVMRDVIAGRDPWLPQLSRTQREQAISQAAAFAVTAPNSVDPLSIATAATVGPVEDIPYQSLSHVRQVNVALRAILWELCGKVRYCLLARGCNSS